jgi:hypothetical protein
MRPLDSQVVDGLKPDRLPPSGHCGVVPGQILAAALCEDGSMVFHPHQRTAFDGRQLDLEGLRKRSSSISCFASALMIGPEC